MVREEEYRWKCRVVKDYYRPRIECASDEEVAELERRYRMAELAALDRQYWYGDDMTGTGVALVCLTG
ncbi:MAG: hypothetical protein Q4B30_07870 [Coriobacteriaceae bacterium]|nr:hypothetical protein [Coriobacteriaceae bacterium]